MKKCPPVNKISSVILCITLSFLALTGCGQDAGTAEQTGQDPDTAQAATESIEELPAADADESSTEQGPAVSALSISDALSDMYVAQIPGIRTDRFGYAARAEKRAIFCAEVLPATFEVRRDDTGERVYQGDLSIIAGADAEEGGSMQVAFGDFTSLDTAGRYYLYAPFLGESCAFEITESPAEQICETALRRYYLNRCGIALTQEYAGQDAHGVCHSAPAALTEGEGTIDVAGGWHMNEYADRLTGQGAQVMLNLLLAYELNPAAFADDSDIPESGNKVPDILDELRIGASWLLKMQDGKSGGVYGGALTRRDAQENSMSTPVEVQPVSAEATILFAQSMADFGYHYRSFDKEFATSCLRAADRAFSWYMQASDDSASPEVFAAAALLYRATGQEEYAERLQAFFSREDFFERAMWEEPLFIGAVTYLSTVQDVDVEAEEKLMKALVAAAEVVADDSNHSIYGAKLGGRDDELPVEDILHRMRILAVCDHVSYSYEYTRILEQHLHVLCGRNPDAQDYLTGFAGDAAHAGYPGIYGRPVENAELVVAAAMLMAEGD